MRKFIQSDEEDNLSNSVTLPIMDYQYLIL